MIFKMLFQKYSHNSKVLIKKKISYLIISQQSYYPNSTDSTVSLGTG